MATKLRIWSNATLESCRAPRAGSQEVIAAGDWSPGVDILETDKAFVIKAEIPEVNKKGVSIINRTWGKQLLFPAGCCKRQTGKKFSVQNRQ